MQYPSYHEYRSTNVLWYSDIPKEWKTIRLKFSTYIKGRVGWHGLNSNEFMLDGDYYLVTGTDFRGRKIDWSKCYRIEEERFNEDPYIHLKDGDLLVTKDGTIGKVAQVENIPYKATLNSGIFVTRPELGFEYDTSYMYYVLTSDVFKNFVDNQKSGTTIVHLYQNVFEDFEYPFPEALEEQQKIAAFLDYKTQQIDQLIKKKKALIEKLEEKRIAVITQAVTKGLDKNAKLKPSGVDWLGDVPEHWVVQPVKFMTQIIRGKFSHRPRNDPAFYNGEYPFIQTGDVSQVGKYVESYSQTLNDKGYAVSKEFPTGTLVMTIAANIGDMAIINFNACFPDSIVGFVPEKKINLNFLYYMFLAMKNKLMSTAVLNTQLNLNIDRIASLFSVCPPEKEQSLVYEFLDSEMKRIDEIKNKMEEAVNSLVEYRVALITSAVTGKIDVREVPIPREVV